MNTHTKSFLSVSIFKQRKNDRIRHVTAYLRSVDQDFQFLSAMIQVHVLLLPQGILLEKMVITVILRCFHNDLQLMS